MGMYERLLLATTVADDVTSVSRCFMYNAQDKLRKGTDRLIGPL